MKFKFFISLFIVFLSNVLFAQNSNIQRGLIDAQRGDMDYFDKKGYVSANTFLKQDSSYYVGWMYLGSYMYNIAADQQGYTSSIPPLMKSLSLLEKDYSIKLKTHASSSSQWLDVYKYQKDYNQIINCLYNAYTVLEKPDSLLYIVNRYQKFDFQKDYGEFIGQYLTKAWIYHRNRFITNILDPNFKANIEENEKLALKYIDSAKLRRLKFESINNALFSSEYNESNMTSVYHMQSVLYSYLKDYKKAEKAFDDMSASGSFNYNNYALLKMEKGEFNLSMENFNLQKAFSNDDKSLEEWIYYKSMLNGYQNQNATSIQELNDWIAKVGSTPGFGWYNIALARAYINDGDFVKSNAALNKALNFDESYIGTTLGQEQYNLSILFIKLKILECQLESQKFENKYWFTSLHKLTYMLNIRWNLMLTRWTLMNSLTVYQERQKVLYELFSSESTFAWDEVWNILKKFSQNFFEKKYKVLLQNKNLPSNIIPHYQYALAYSLQKTGNDVEAMKYINQILKSNFQSSAFSKMLMAKTRLLGLKIDQDNFEDKLNKIYNLYPQLLPFTNYKMKFNVFIYGDKSKSIFKKTLKSFYNCRFSKTDNIKFPKANITFSENEGVNYANITVTNNLGKTIVNNFMFSIKDPEKDGKKLAYLLFNIGNAKQETQLTF